MGGEASTLRHLAAAWSAMSKAHNVHSMHEEKVIFPVLEGFFPGQVCSLLVWNTCKRGEQVLAYAIGGYTGALSNDFLSQGCSYAKPGHMTFVWSRCSRPSVETWREWMAYGLNTRFRPVFVTCHEIAVEDYREAIANIGRWSNERVRQTVLRIKVACNAHCMRDMAKLTVVP